MFSINHDHIFILLCAHKTFTVKVSKITHKIMTVGPARLIKRESYIVMIRSRNIVIHNICLYIYLREVLLIRIKMDGGNSERKKI